ncbi:hypothetical protein VTJ83DRAFT_5064 [Remersonia thermophila]|uniref:Uncharacterized protein n=1 Tax=Remersonia thermophila TaxID=72144 RepID=A0ABR4DBQ4_9PEZI
MVGGRNVLLSIAVLSGLCFDSVLGGHIRRQHDGAGAPSRKDAVLPRLAVATEEPGSTSGEGSSSESSSSSSSAAAAAATLVVSSSSSSSTTTTTSSSSTTPRVPPVPPSRPTGGGVVLQVSSSLGLGAAATSSQYVDPPVFFVNESLTTDTNAPTRTVGPTMPTVAPSPGTSRAPPPVDEPSSSSQQVRVPPTRPGGGIPAAPTTTQPVSDIVVSIDLGNPGGATTSTVLWGGGNQQPQPASSASVSSSESSPSPPAQDNGGGGNVPQDRPTPPRPRPSNSPPPLPTTVPVTYEVTESIDLGFPSTTPTTLLTSILPANETFTYGPSSTVRYCQASDLTAAPTMWSVVHTTTVTWYGHPEDYTPPFPPLELPGPTVGCVMPLEPPRLTISICASTGTDSKYRTCERRPRRRARHHRQEPGRRLHHHQHAAVRRQPGAQDPPRPHLGDGGPGGPVGRPADPARLRHVHPRPQAITTPAQPPVTTPVTIGIQPTAVVINDQTFTDIPGQPTQTVVVGGATFTIDPTRVVGGGSTIDRPAYTGGVSLPTPTSTRIDNLPVVVSSSSVIIGSSTFSLPPANQPTAQPTTVVVSSRTFTIGPSTIAGGSQTLSLPTYPKPTEVVTAGGSLVTAIGSSILVVRSTTYTYGVPGASVITVTVDDKGNADGSDDVVLTLGPGGVTARGGQVLTIGGTNAAGPTDTQYALVGGATITKVGPSVVVVAGSTYTLGGTAAGGLATTTVVDVDGTQVTIGPSAVQIGTMTVATPFGTTTVLLPGATAQPAGRGRRPAAAAKMKGPETRATTKRTPPARSGLGGLASGSAPRWLLC